MSVAVRVAVSFLVSECQNEEDAKNVPAHLGAERYAKIPPQNRFLTGAVLLMLVLANWAEFNNFPENADNNDRRLLPWRSGRAQRPTRTWISAAAPSRTEHRPSMYGKNKIALRPGKISGRARVAL